MKVKLILLALFAIIGLESCCSTKPIVVKTTDTIYVDKKLPDVIVDSLKPKTILVKVPYPVWDTTIVIDTVREKGEIIYRTKAYTATVDTVIGSDTISFDYHFPGNYIKQLSVKHKPIRVPYAVNNQLMQAVAPFPKWLIYLLIALCGGLGFYLGFRLGVKK